MAQQQSVHHAVSVLAWFSVIWMAVESLVALFAAWLSHSVALLAFGGDSVIELVSAMLVLGLAAGNDRHNRPWTGKLASVLLMLLIGAVIGASYFSLHGRLVAERSWIGIVVLGLSALIMPWLADRKRRLARANANVTLRADAVQSAVCGYLAWIGLVGVAFNTAFQWHWADPLAALLITPLIGIEVKRAWTGSETCC